MENKPHCFAKMLWILDEPHGKEKNVCNRCESNIKDCLRRTRETAEKLKTQIEKLKKNGELDVFSPRLKDLFDGHI